MKRLITIVLLVFTVTYVHAQVTVVRGPYIQIATQNSIVIKWRTNTATTSRVIYGLDQINLIYTVNESANTTEHEVELTGLNMDTKYYYSIGNATDLLSASPDQFFYTLPPTNTEREYNFWVVGDCGTANNDQRAVRDAYQTYMGTTRIYGMIMLGDNAYTLGTDGEYQNAIFNNMYEDIVSNTVMWPTPGNHDYYSGADASTQTGPYYDIFTLPSAGQLGGLISGTEAYYSYNIGNIHFISIDSYDSGRDSTNAMGAWLKQDLQNNNQEWTIAYWHHAPYSKGNHNSDNPFPFVDGELKEMREQFVPILERYGVDLILCGHSHAYERSFFLKGHYGESSTFNPSHQVDNGSGDFVTDCPYIKNTQSSEAFKGTVYAVVGVSGKTQSPSSSWPHPAMHIASTDHLGSMMLTIKNNRLDAKFVTSTNSIYDQFTIIKNAGGVQTITVCQGMEATLEPSFPATQYVWTPGNINATSLTINPFFNSFYYGADPMGCIKDTFQISVIQPGSPQDTCDWTAGMYESANELVFVHPNPVKIGEVIRIEITNQSENKFQLDWLDVSGKLLSSNSISNGINIVPTPGKITPGIYFIKVYLDKNIYIHKLILTD